MARSDDDSIVAAASASDDIGVVGVQFFLDGVPLGAEDLVAPYAATWDTAATPGGNHSLTARARDAAGNQTMSLPTTVTVSNQIEDTTPPAGSITSPANGATLSGTQVLVAANAFDDVGVLGVQFLLDGAPFGLEDLTAPYSTVWDTTQVPDGGHTLTARARDAAGNETVFAAVSVEVNNQSPDPPGTDDSGAGGTSVNLELLRLPIPGMIVIRADPDLDGVATLALHIDGELTDSVSGDSLEHLWDTRTLMGSHQVEVVAYDSSGSEIIASASVFGPTTSSRDATTDLRLRALDAPGFVAIRAESRVDGAGRMELYIERELVATAMSGSLEYGWNAASSTERYEILVVTYDATGVVATARIIY